MNKKLIQLTILMIITLQLLSLTPNGVINGIEEVAAAEEDETDYFETLPEYRWFSEETTGDNVTEQLTGGAYEIYSSENQTTGTQAYAKSRELVSRDVEFDARLKIDVGGNQTGYFRDVVGDACDFVEGDTEGLTGLLSQSVSDGIFSGKPAAGSVDYIDITISEFSCEVYDTIKFRTKGSESMVISVVYAGVPNSGWTAVYNPNPDIEISEWVDFELTDLSEWSGSKRDVLIEYRPDSVGGSFTGNEIIYLEYFELIGSLDYPTHVEDDVEDTWDWEDSLEYFYNDYGNVSDFNDGTTEDWVDKYWTTLSNDDSWLKIDFNGAANTFMTIQTNTTHTITAATYKWFTMEIENTGTTTIDTTIIYDGAGNTVFRDYTNVASGNKHLVSGDLTLDPDWTGTETGLDVRFDFTSSSTDHEVKANFTYLYDSEFGDLEGWSGLEREYVEPSGIYHGTCTTGSNDKLLSETNLNIDTSLFDRFVFRMQTNNDELVFILQDAISGDGLTTTQTVDSVGWVTYSLDLTLDPDWSGIITRLNIRFDEDDGTLDGNEEVRIEYALLLGNWSRTDGFSYSLLNSKHERSMDIKFTRPDGNTDNYNATINFYDSSGVESSYATEFGYDPATEWLLLDFQFDIDKKRLKITLEYENGTDIIRLRRITDVVGGMGTPQWLLFENGFPHLCINNSVGSMGRSLVYLDYIDANWKLNNWYKVTETVTSGAVDTNSPYGMSVYKSTASVETTWRQSIDKFDGVSAEMISSVAGIDASDLNELQVELYTVYKNGTAEKLLEFQIQHLSTSRTAFIYTNRPSFVVPDKSFFGVAGSTFSLQFSIFRESETRFVAQAYSEVGGAADQIIVDMESTYENFTREVFIDVTYDIDNTNSGVADDEFSLSLVGYDVTRKDILRDFVGYVIEGFEGILGLVLTPLIVTLNLILSGLKLLNAALGETITVVFGAVGDLIVAAINTGLGLVTQAINGLDTLLQPLFTALESGIDTIMTGVETALSGAIGLVEAAVDLVTTAVENIVGDLFDALWLFATELSLLLEDIIIELMPLMNSILSELTTFFTTWWDSFVNDFLIPVVVAVFTALGIESVLYMMLDFFAGIVSVIADIMTIVTWLFTATIEIGIYWLVLERVSALLLTLFVIAGLWVMFDWIPVFMDFAYGDVTIDQFGNAMDQTIRKVSGIFNFLWKLGTYILDFVISIISVIGNYIPLT